MDAKPKSRRRHSQQFKAEILAACAEPGASVAAVARRFELNDNMVHQWRRDAAKRSGSGAVTAALPAPFVALALPAPQAPTSEVAPVQPIRVEIQRGAMTLNVSWPTGAAAECAGWLRELLR